jgi:CMP-2-keto-3-deoxyoctulosonic acid synthetase
MHPALFLKFGCDTNLRRLSSANGKDSVITFKIFETLAAEDEEGLAVYFGTSSNFVFSDDILASFRFLGAYTFGSGTIFRFCKASWSSLTDRTACLLRILTILFLLTPPAPSSSLL